MRPFQLDESNYAHTNFQEVREISKQLDGRGYNIDVVRYEYAYAIDFSKYDLLIGFGRPFENSFMKPFSGHRIYVATGASTQQRNYAELRRIQQLKSRRGRLLQPRRIKPYPDFASATLSDAIFCTGNHFTIQTYREIYDGPIYRIPVSVHQTLNPAAISRNYPHAQSNFLWFGGNGLVHKGLDLCIEAFAGRPELTLHICGPREEEFFDVYQEELARDNIHYHGFVDVRSKEYKAIVERCAFVIFPSCSEGGCVSVLNVMQYGLIPVVTEEASIDTQAAGYLMKSVNVEDIQHYLDHLSSLPIERLRTEARSLIEWVEEHHSLLNYRSAFANALTEVIS